MTPYDQGRLAAIKLAGLVQAMEGPLAHALEVGGLATLAAPTVNDMVDPSWIQTERRRNLGHIAELVGLTTLATPSIVKLVGHL